MEKILRSERLIRFQDCDPFNHLNNARYLDYFINAREDQVQEHYNLAIYDYAKISGKGWVVASNQISYIRPATTMETVLIESQLVQFTNKWLLVECRMWDKNQTELKAVMWTKLMQVDLKNGGITTHSDEHMQLFESVHAPVEAGSFEERSMQLIKQSKAVKA